MGRVFAALSEATDVVPKANDTLASILATEPHCQDAITWQEVALCNWGSDDPAEVNRALAEVIGCREPDADDPSRSVLDPALGPKPAGTLKIPKLLVRQELADKGEVVLKLQGPPVLKPRLRVILVRAAAPDKGLGVAKVQVTLEGPTPGKQATAEKTGEAIFEPLKAEPGYQVSFSLEGDPSDGHYQLPSEKLEHEVQGHWDPPLRLEVEPGSLLKLKIKLPGEETFVEGVVAGLRGPQTCQAKTEGPSKEAVFKALKPGKYDLDLVLPGDVPVELKDAAELELLPYATLEKVLELAKAELEAAEKDLGRIEINTDVPPVELTVKNTGGMPLHLHKAEKKEGADGFQVEIKNPVILPGQEGKLALSFKTDELGPKEAIFKLSCSDPKSPLELKLKAQGDFPLKNAPPSDGLQRAREVILELWQDNVPAGCKAPVNVGTVPPQALKDAVKKGGPGLLALLRQNPSNVHQSSKEWASGGAGGCFDATLEVRNFFKGVFAAIQAVPGVATNPCNSFHGHMFFCGPDGPVGPQEGELGVLFHTMEYPLDLPENPAKHPNPGFSANDANYRNRNVLYLMSKQKAWVVEVQNQPGSGVGHEGPNFPLSLQAEMLSWVVPGVMTYAQLGLKGPNDAYRFNAVGDSFVYALGVKLPDVNLLPNQIADNGNPALNNSDQLFFKAY